MKNSHYQTICRLLKPSAIRKVILFCFLNTVMINLAVAQASKKKNNHNNSPSSYTTKDYVIILKKVTDLMVNDVTSPVAASRYYAYINLAAYEVINQREELSLMSSLKREKLSLTNFSSDLSFEKIYRNPSGNSATSQNTSVLDQHKSFAALLTILKMGERLLPSGPALRPEITLLKTASKKYGIQEDELTSIEIQIDSIVKSFVSWSAQDGFRALNNRLRYTPTNGDAYWQPTAPSYMAPVEPHWNKLKPFFLDSCSQFKVAKPVLYDTNSGTPFMNLTKEVYEISQKSDSTKKAIAMFWDCNPFAVQQLGHVEFGLKKISPGGHWIGITGIACINENLSLEQSALVHAIVSITLADAFIACWDEKYRSNRVRPETVINRLIDPSWRPLLQTPPFPEYVSGHSVASTAAAEVLTKIFGENYSFTDDTEVEFELPIRKFESFNSAAAEASISRLYGGIHFRDAIDQGIQQGRSIGNLSNRIFDQHIRKLKISYNASVRN
jgi:hypothetical protein